MYFSITTTYLHHKPGDSIDNIEKLMKVEVEQLDRDQKNIVDAVETVVGGFFMAILTQDKIPESCLPAELCKSYFFLEILAISYIYKLLAALYLLRLPKI